MSEDGVTPVGKLNPNYEVYYNTHAPCIDAVKRSGVNFVIFCPGYMKSLGFKSNPMPKITVNRPAGGFVSFEDAAQVMLHAAEVKDYDGELVSAATDVPSASS